MMKEKRTCKIIFLPNEVPQRKGRPHINRWFPSRKRLLEAGRQVGRKAQRCLPVTA